METRPKNREKINQRTMLTKRLLQDSLIDLLKTTSIYKISIRKLCETAGINRSTFYKYYGSQFDLLAEMERELIATISDILAAAPKQKTETLTKLFSYLEDNIEFCRLLVNNNVDPQFPEALFATPLIRQMAGDVIGSGCTKSELEYTTCFLTYGAFQMAIIWLNKEERESPAEIARLMLKLLDSHV